jgi:hypothetical protein
MNPMVIRSTSVLLVSWEIQERCFVPDDLPQGNYQLEVAILDRAGTNLDTRPLPPLQLGIAARNKDGWYTLSQIVVE